MKSFDIKKAMLLYAVTDRAWLGEQTLYQQVNQALSGGATCIQLREKDLGQEEFLKEALEIRDLCQHFDVPFIINDNVELAIRCEADGVHVGQNDMQAGKVRQLIGPDKILGVSAQTMEQAKLAEENGADYLGVGAVFPTSTKDDAKPVSHETLREIADSVSIPICAIGGINKQNLPQLSGTGIDGVALVSAIFASNDIEAECRRLRTLCETMTRR